MSEGRITRNLSAGEKSSLKAEVIIDWLE
jgi:hypothetical protein